VGASYLNNKVTLMTVDLNNVRTKPEPVPAAAFPTRSASVRKSFSKEKLLPGAFSVKKSPTSDTEKTVIESVPEVNDTKEAFFPQRTCKFQLLVIYYRGTYTPGQPCLTVTSE